MKKYNNSSVVNKILLNLKTIKISEEKIFLIEKKFYLDQLF